MTFAYRNRKIIMLGILIVLGIASTIIYIVLHVPEKEEEIEEISMIEKKEEKEEIIEKYKVDIKGEIIAPGIYSLESSSRIIDVIEKAGGLTENADTSVINLSKKISDEMVIIIYSREEVENFEATKEKEQALQEKCHQKDENTLINDACITKEQESTHKISINTATLEELMTLPGIGESKAKDIISYREQNGPFKELKELLNVSGIGESTLANIQEDITL